ncbi:uncharacterized protein CLUP02_10065 [Colletotrichum lupini]|uniref:Uncharacterized protein n=1 Tax=Colletotrichum lupini TaxID=145971 RepID=A0A9Q8SW50_9PEZI|nr:uncharacterized protein CLUP02_10065 [Colletotrichum lupini]UQC84568.1 hypothetical protein CLUP02_10065 [Colletotrichum lupini]
MPVIFRPVRRPRASGPRAAKLESHNLMGTYREQSYGVELRGLGQDGKGGVGRWEAAQARPLQLRKLQLSKYSWDIIRYLNAQASEVLEHLNCAVPAGLCMLRYLYLVPACLGATHPEGSRAEKQWTRTAAKEGQSLCTFSDCAPAWSYLTSLVAGVKFSSSQRPSFLCLFVFLNPFPYYMRIPEVEMKAQRPHATQIFQAILAEARHSFLQPCLITATVAELEARDIAAASASPAQGFSRKKKTKKKIGKAGTQTPFFSQTLDLPVHFWCLQAPKSLDISLQLSNFPPLLGLQWAFQLSNFIFMLTEAKYQTVLTCITIASRHSHPARSGSVQRFPEAENCPWAEVTNPSFPTLQAIEAVSLKLGKSAYHLPRIYRLPSFTPLRGPDSHRLPLGSCELLAPPLPHVLPTAPGPIVLSNLGSDPGHGGFLDRRKMLPIRKKTKDPWKGEPSHAPD